ncbi:MAG: hypothetical protein ACRC80_02125 [Waterburya sp.]|jgi:hypothetical protein
MSSNNKWESTFKNVLEVPRKLVRYIVTSTTRLFSPNDDDYPATGIQPFTGEPNEKGE